MTSEELQALWDGAQEFIHELFDGLAGTVTVVVSLHDAPASTLSLIEAAGGARISHERDPATSYGGTRRYEVASLDSGGGCSGLDAYHDLPDRPDDLGAEEHY